MTIQYLVRQFFLRLSAIATSFVVFLTSAVVAKAQMIGPKTEEEAAAATKNSIGVWGQGRCVTTVSMGEGENAVIKEVATFRGIECLLANVLNVAVTFVGLAAFVMVIYGAFLYLTSGGSSKGTEAGKQALTYAIIGIVVALMAFWILNLIATFTGVSGILNFSLSLD